MGQIPRTLWYYFSWWLSGLPQSPQCGTALEQHKSWCWQKGNIETEAAWKISVLPSSAIISSKFLTEMNFCQDVSAKTSTWKCNFNAALFSGIWNSLVQVYWLLLLVVTFLNSCHIMTFAVAQCFCVPRRELFWCLQYQGGHYNFVLNYT